IFQFDFLRYCYSIFRDERRTEFLVENHIAALRPERDLYCICQGITPPQDRLSRCFTVNVRNLLEKWAISAHFLCQDFGIDSLCNQADGRYWARTNDLSGVNRMLFQLS